MTSTREKIGFRMQLLPGNIDEYRRRHDEIWPELVVLLQDAGVTDYSIFYHEPTNSLFATLYRTANHGMDALPEQPVMQRWWAYMADLMDTHSSNEPVVEPLDQVFHMA